MKCHLWHEGYIRSCRAYNLLTCVICQHIWRHIRDNSITSLIRWFCSFSKLSANRHTNALYADTLQHSYLYGHTPHQSTIEHYTTLTLHLTSSEYHHYFLPTSTIVCHLQLPKYTITIYPSHSLISINISQSSAVLNKITTIRYYIEF